MSRETLADFLGAALLAAGLVANTQHRAVLSRIFALGAVVVWHLPDLLASGWV